MRKAEKPIKEIEDRSRVTKLDTTLRKPVSWINLSIAERRERRREPVYSEDEEGKTPDSFDEGVIVIRQN